MRKTRSKTDDRRGIASGVRGKNARGVTFIELLVVVAIVASFSSLLISSYGRFLSGHRVSVAFSKVNSTFHYARNLAIANNAVYHVRFESFDTNASSPTYNTVLPEQAISIYCFPAMSRALGVTEERHVTEAGQWNPFNALTRIDPNTNTPAATTYDHYLVDRVVLPLGTYAGVQYLPNSPAPANHDKLIFFKPDGTVSSATTVFVTDNIALADDRALGSYDSLQEDRRAYYNTRKWVNTPEWAATGRNKPMPAIKMIQIYLGGMIKERAFPGPTNQL